MRHVKGFSALAPKGTSSKIKVCANQLIAYWCAHHKFPRLAEKGIKLLAVKDKI
jgi:hypothetical protein